MKHEIITAKPDDIILENEGAEYSPGDTAALRTSYELTKGWAYPPIVYWHPKEKNLHCIDGNHRILVLRMRGWGDTPIPVIRMHIPKGIQRDERGLLEWRLRLRAHLNSKRRVMGMSEWKAIFEKAQMELGWTQEQIGAQYGFDQADVSRVLKGVIIAERSKEIREKKKKVMVRTINFPKALHSKLRAADSGDKETVKELQMAFWSIGRKLLALGASLPDPGNEDPWKGPEL